MVDGPDHCFSCGNGAACRRGLPVPEPQEEKAAGSSPGDCHAVATFVRIALTCTLGRQTFCCESCWRRMKAHAGQQRVTIERPACKQVKDDTAGHAGNGLLNGSQSLQNGMVSELENPSITYQDKGSM